MLPLTTWHGIRISPVRVPISQELIDDAIIDMIDEFLLSVISQEPRAIPPPVEKIYRWVGTNGPYEFKPDPCEEAFIAHGIERGWDEDQIVRAIAQDGEDGYSQEIDTAYEHFCTGWYESKDYWRE